LLHGVSFIGQGKWYPGEELFPRWQYALYWRKDVWKNDALIAKEDGKIYFLLNVLLLN
jgi:uncharacterized protein (DUF2126 family)